MKPYFSKLLTEKERVGHSNPSQKWGLRLKYDPDCDYEDQPKRAPMSRHRCHAKHEGKHLTDVLNPLKGFLRKSVGKRWDEVYSELCSSLDRRSVSGLHVFQHLFGFVSVKCWQDENGKIYQLGAYGWDADKSSLDDFYVHPKTGILCKSPEYEGSRSRWKRRLKEAPVEKIKLSQGKSLNLIKGVWYYVAYKLVTNVEVKIDRQGNPYKHSYDTWEFDKKQQLNKKELKYWKLKNAPVV